MRSTVPVKALLAEISLRPDKLDRREGGEEGRDESGDIAPTLGGDGELVWDRPQKLFEGVWVPGVAGTRRLGCKASDAAFNKRFVVPRAFVDPDLAEQTTTSLCWSR